MPKLVKWQDLHPSQQQAVLRSFPYWNENDGAGGPASVIARLIQQYGWTKKTWAAAHSFYVRSDGRLAERPGYCVPQTLGAHPSPEAVEMEAVRQQILAEREEQANRNLARAVALIEREAQPGWAAAEANGFPDVDVEMRQVAS
jgi:hypothetical protein